MSCQLNDSQIQSWLDGDSDESQHLSECSECQQRMLSVQKLRSRLAPPPSPLGRDFARRTAQHVLRVSDVHKPHKPQGGWWSRLTDNPLLHVVQRERARRLVRVPGLAAILLLYLLPGGFVFQSGDPDANWAFFGMMRIGLTVLVPLFLLSLEWSSLSALVRGRCLEEMLQAGLKPAVVSDTLALSGLRSLFPALLITGLALLPVHPQSLLAWLPLTLIAFSAAGYLSQAHLVGLSWPRWLTILGTAAVAGSLGAPAPWNLVCTAALAGLGYVARRQSVNSLELQQQGRLPAPRRNRGSVWQAWLARRLPDLALLQRELRRRNLFTPSILLGNLGVCVAAYTVFGSNAYCWPILAGAAGLLTAFSLVQREKDGGAYEVLLHSGLRPDDFWTSAAWIAGLQFLPACLAGAVCACLQLWAASPVSGLVAAFGSLLALLVSLWAGAVIGASLAWKAQTPRQASTRCVQEVALLGLLSLLLIGLVPPLVGSGSPLSRLLQFLDLTLSEALDGLAILPTMLALHLRARWLSQAPQSVNPWVGSLALLVPMCLWLQLISANSYQVQSLANFCAGLTLMIGLGWAWWAAPLAQQPSKQRWSVLTLSYLVALLVGIPVVMWSTTILNGFRMGSLPQGLHEVDALGLLGLTASAGWLIYLLGVRFQWRASSSPDFRKRSWAAGFVSAGLIGYFSLGMARLAWEPRPHAAQFRDFLQKNQTPQTSPSVLRKLLKGTNLSSYPYYHGFKGLSLADQSWELRNLKSVQQSFQKVLARMLADSTIGSLSDRSQAFRVVILYLDQALYLHQPLQTLEHLEQLVALTAQSAQWDVHQARQMSLAVRGRILLAARSQSWTAAQLDRLDQLQASLPDDPAHAGQSRDLSAALTYDTLLHDRWSLAENAPNDPLTRYFFRQQAEIFLEGYLSGSPGQKDGSLAQNFIWQLKFFRNDEVSLVAAAGNRLVLDLERWKKVHGRYPDQWKEHSKDMKIAYRPTADSYEIRVWLSREDGPPLKLFSDGPRLLYNNYR